MKKIMILGASILQLPAIQKAKAMGYGVVAVDMDPNAIGFSEEGIDVEVISTIDIPRVVEAAKRHRVDGVMTLASDMPMRTVAAVAKELGIVGIDDDTAVRATNKARMRQALAAAGVPIPRFFEVSSKEEYEVAVREIGKGIIVKPADNSGSRGVYKLEDLSDWDTVMGAYEYSHRYSRSGAVMVEECMLGTEVSVETISQNGVCHVVQITDKMTIGAPYFVEIGHTQPSAFSDEMKERIKEVAIAANRAIGIQNGPSHTELMITEDGPKVVELGARLGGDCITTHLVPLSTGVDMVELCIRIALGETPSVIPHFQKASAIRYFPHKTGIIKSIDGVEAARAIEGVKQVSVVHGVGETIGELNSSVARIGFVIAQGDTADIAAERCRLALEQIQIRYFD